MDFFDGFMEITLNHRICRTRDEVLAAATPQVADFLDEWFSPTDFVWGHTSGSTGTPKPLKLLKRDMEESARLTLDFFGITSGTTMLLCLSPDYIAGKMMIVRALLSGADLLVVSPSSLPFSTIDEPVDFAALVPAQVVESLRDDTQRERLSRTGSLIIGGAPLSPAAEARLSELPVHAYATYGMTETVSHVALRCIGDSSMSYRALGNITFTVDERDCLVIHTPHFAVKQFVTNDVVSLADERTFRWIGRYDHVINSGGVKIFPERVEQKIAALFTRRFFIIACADEKWGECVALAIEGDPLPWADEVALLARIRAAVDRYEVPRRVVYLPVFAETSSGKVIRHLP